MKKLFFILVSFFSITFADDITGKQFLDFYGKDESGKILKLSDVAGKGQPVVVVFWALGDVDTYKSLPKINRLYEKYKSKVMFVAPLLSKSDLKEVQEAKRVIPMSLPVWLAGTDSIKAYQIDRVDVPYLVFILKDGKIQNIIKTAKDEKQIEEKIKRLLDN